MQSAFLGVPSRPDDLVIVNARVLDVRTGRVAANRTVRLSRGVIRSIEDAGPEPAALRRIDARGRLLSPGLIDVDHHTAYVLGDSLTPGGGIVARLVMNPDSIVACRRRFAAAYLPYGVTTVREAGGDERYAPMMQAWMTSVPWAPDHLPVGGALDAGVRDFEHVYTLAREVLSRDQQDSLWQAHSVPLLEGHTEGLFLVTTMDLFHTLQPSKLQ